MNALRRIYFTLQRLYRRRQNRRARERHVVYTWHDERQFSQRRYYPNGGTLQ